MFFPAKVNFALAKLGINPNQIRAEYRQGAQTVGKASGNSPQEVALFIASQLPVAFQLEMNQSTVKSWIREGRINVHDPEMKAALIRLQWDELLGYG